MNTFKTIMLTLMLVIFSAVSVSQTIPQTQNASQSEEATKLLQQGWKLRHAKKMKAALQSFQDALISYRNIRDRKGEGIVLMSIAAIYGDIENNNKAIEYYQKALLVMKEISDHFNEGRVSLGLGMCYRDLKNYNKAIEYHQHSLTIAREISDQEGEMFALKELGNDYYSQGNNVKNVDDSLEESVVILSPSSNSYDDMKNGEQTSEAAQQFNLKGVQQYQKGQFKEAINIYLEALSISIVEGARDTEGQTRNLIGTSYRQLAQYQQALEYYQQALNLFQEIGDSATESVVLTNIAVVYSYQEQYQQALKYYQRALVISGKEDSPILEGRTLLNIGNVYYMLGQYQKALGSYQEALVIGQKLDDRVIESYSLTNIGKIYHALANQYRASDALQLLQIGMKQADEREHKTALAKFQQALSIFKAVGNHSDKKMSDIGHFGEATALIWMGKIYDHTDQYQEALITYQQALTISKKIGEQDMEEIALSKLGEIYHRLGLYQKALEFHQQALKIRRQKEDKQGEATILFNIGEIYLKLNKEKQSLNYFNQASTIIQKLNAPMLEGAILNNRAVIFRRWGKYQSALELLRKALAISKNMATREKEGEVLINIAAIYHDLEQNEKALEFLQQALPLSRESGDITLEKRILSNIKRLQEAQSDDPMVRLFHDITDHQGYELLRKGMQQLVGGEHQTALRTFQRSLAMFQKEAYNSRIALNLFLICRTYNNLGQYQTALEFCQQALTISNALGGPIKGEKIDLLMLLGFIDIDSKILNEIGFIYFNLGQYQKALEILQKVSSINQKKEYWKEEKRTFSLMGMSYLHLNQYQLALESFQQALVISQRLKKSIQLDESSLFNGMGVIYREIGQYQKAIDYFQQALTISKKTNNRREKGTIFFNLGDVYRKQGEYQNALEHWKQALTISQENQDRKFEGTILNSMGIAYEKSKQYQKSLKFHLQALALSREMGDRHNEGYILNNIGLIYSELGRYQEAQTFYQQAIEIHENIGSNPWLQLRGLGLVNLSLKQFDAGIIYLEQAIDGIEKLRTGLIEKEHKLFFIQDKLYVYDELIAILQVLHLLQPTKDYDQKSFEIFERKQGRVFLEEMGKSGARRFTGIPEKITQKEQELVQQISATRKNRNEALEKGLDADPHRQRLEKLEVEQQAFEKNLETDYPAYYALKYPKPVDLATLQNQVLRKGEMMLVYGVMEDSTVLWIIGKDQFQMLPLSLKEDELIQQVKTFRDTLLSIYKAIENAGKIGYTKTEFAEFLETKVEDSLPNFFEISHKLYQNLLPIEARQWLNKAQLVYVVPTGPLDGLPFEALVTHIDEDTETPHYLIQEVAIAYLSSASLLKTLRETQTSNQTKAPEPLLAFADPIYPSCPKQQNIQKRNDDFFEFRTRAYQDSVGGCFKRLPKTVDEVTEIAQWLKAPMDKALKLGEAASRETVFNTKLDDYRHIVFATHAILPNETSIVTPPALVLSHQKPDKNAYLTMADVFGLKLNADSVTLSACNTGQGEDIKGEGIRGLTRAFMYAGTPAVSVTLWAVESQSAKSLSTGMFKYLTQIPPNLPLQKGGMSLAEALQQAKLELLTGKGKTYESHPYFWAPFVIWGDGFSVPYKESE